ncbi:MAG: hypothetical protein JW941_04910 [Candidatus Coatesbacteria bacterium]|nr:hypothetical protein [Candidatus Coatesbacteria bacterium]
MALDVPRPQIVSQFVPIVLASAAVILTLLRKMKLRKGIDSGTRVVCALGAVAFLLLSSPMITDDSQYSELLSGPVLLCLIIALSAVLVRALLLNADELSLKALLVALAIVCAMCFYWFGLWTYDQHPPDGDEPYYLLTAHSIGYDFDIDRTNNFENKDYLAYYPYELQPQYRSILIKGKKYEVPNYNIGYPILIALPYRLFGFRGAAAFMNLVAALLVVNVFLLGLEAGASRKHALMGALLFGFSVPMVNYANQIFPAAVTALFTIYAFRLLLKIDGGRRREIVILIVLCVALFMLKIRLSLVIGPILLLAIWKVTRRKVVWLYAAGVAGILGVVGFLLRDKIDTLRLLTSRLDELLRMGSSDLTPANGVLGQMLDQQFGLLVLAPIYLFSLVGAYALYKRNKSMLARMIFVIAPYYLVVGAMPWWNASWCPPCRFLIVILPFFGALIGLGLERIATLRQASVFSFAAAVSAIVTFLHLFSPVFRYDQPNGANRAFWLINTNTYIDFSRLLPSFFRTDISTPLEVFLEMIAFGLLLFLAAKSSRRKLPSRSLLESGRFVYAAGIGVASVAFLLAAGAICDITATRSNYQLEDEPLSIYDPPSRAYIKGGRRITPGYPFEREILVSPGEKFIIVEAMMRDPIWTTVPNMWLELSNESETVRVIDEPVQIELMQKYYRRVRLSGGNYTMRLGTSIPGVDMKKINPDKVANVYVDRIQIFDEDGIEGFLYATFGRIFNLLSIPEGMEYMGHAYFINPQYKQLGERLFQSFISARMWPEAADVFSQQADRDPFNLSQYTPDQLLQLAKAELVKKRYGHALQLLRPVPSADAIYPSSRLVAAEAHYRRGEFDAALSVLPDNLKEVKEVLKADYIRALCLLDEGDSERAYRILERLAGKEFEGSFDALCKLLAIARMAGDQDQLNRSINLLHEFRTREVSVNEMTKSRGRPSGDGGWLLERNGFFETSVDVLSDTLVLGMEVKAKGTFETHVETGLVIDPTSGESRYIFPDLKVSLDGTSTKYIKVPYYDWTKTYVFFDNVETGTHDLKIYYINDHTFQKDRQDRQFFLRQVSLQSAIAIFKDDMVWQSSPDADEAVFETRFDARFPIKSLTLDRSAVEGKAHAELLIEVDSEQMLSIPLAAEDSGAIERNLILPIGVHTARFILRSAEDKTDFKSIGASFNVIGFEY